MDSGGYLILSSVTGSANPFSINGSVSMNGALEVWVTSAPTSAAAFPLMRWLDTACVDLTSSATVYGVCGGCTLRVVSSEPATACYLMMADTASPSPSPSPASSPSSNSGGSGSGSGFPWYVLGVVAVIPLLLCLGFALWRCWSRGEATLRLFDYGNVEEGRFSTPRASLRSIMHSFNGRGAANVPGVANV